VAVLVTALALFGAMVGDGPHVRVGGAKHAARIWPLVVGKTGSGRKGTSWHEARNLAATWGTYAESYLGHRVVAGLASGEGLIAALVGEDDDMSGVAFGRLTIIESEFARVLTAARREGSTLGPVLRQLWDDGSAATLTKQAVRVDNAHPVVVAHVTPRELRLRLAESDLAGGTLNRFLPVFSERPHLLAHEPSRPDLGDLGIVLGARMATARQLDELSRDPATDHLWTEAYAALAEDEPDGPLGAVLARGPAQVMRLGLVYALADGATSVAAEHLLAGLAVWDYAAQSARLLFADTVARTNRAKLAEFIRIAPDGRTRTEITTKCFSGNLPGSEIDALTDELAAEDLIEVISVKPARGKPTTRYRWTGPTSTGLTDLLGRTYELTR
jgi:cation transporter-like permease